EIEPAEGPGDRLGLGKEVVFVNLGDHCRRVGEGVEFPAHQEIFSPPVSERVASSKDFILRIGFESGGRNKTRTGLGIQNPGGRDNFVVAMLDGRDDVAGAVFALKRPVVGVDGGAKNPPSGVLDGGNVSVEVLAIKGRDVAGSRIRRGKLDKFDQSPQRIEEVLRSVLEALGAVSNGFVEASVLEI